MSRRRTHSLSLPAPIDLAAMSIVVVAAFIAPTAAQGQTDLCLEAERFVRDSMDMVALSEPDTIDDWRTRRDVPGCRVTAAGASRLPSSEVVENFYARVEESGWTRTPDPRDSPHEASLRYRRSGADCLFNFYDNSTTLATEAEMVVSEAVPRQPGENLYNFLVMCIPAAEAAPRG